MELTTTLNEIRKCGPCPDVWQTLLGSLGKTEADDEPLALTRILASNGLNDAVWALRALDGKFDNAVRLFACFCARHVLGIFERERPGDIRPRQTIETAERFARGEATEEDRAAAWVAAWVAALDAALDAARDAAWAARAAAWAARAAAGAAADTDWAAFTPEFNRLCCLEGEYGEVTVTAYPA